MQKLFFSIIIGGLITAAVIFFMNSTSESPNDTAGLRIGKNAIYVAEQTPGNNIIVNVVDVEKPSFVVIHDDGGGTPGAILGVSPLLPAGTSQDIGPIHLSRPVNDGETLYAMIHVDNGDGVFDTATDAPAVDTTLNAPVMMIFVIDAEATQDSKSRF